MKEKEDGPRRRIQGLLSRHAVAQAVECVRQLPEGLLDEGLADYLLGHARMWHGSGYFEEQRLLCDAILAQMPQNWKALHLMGFHAQTAGDFALAGHYYGRALASNPGAAFSRLALAQLGMMQSGFQAGRELYEARFDAVTEASGADWRGLPIARWKGEALCGKAVYIWAEQGLGDIVMFAGFLPYVLGQNHRRAVLGCPEKLMGVFARSFPELEIEPLDNAALHALGPTVMHSFPQIEKQAAISPRPIALEPLRLAYRQVMEHGLFDWAAPMGDLLVHSMPGYIPAQRQASYLKADREKVEAIRQRLAERGAGRRVGISWHTTNKTETARNIPLEKWLPVLAVPGCHFVSLQHHIPSSETEAFCKHHGCPITVLEDMDFSSDAEGLFALVAAMDEVITIDNSNAHIAGALGVPALLLLPLGHNYRWPDCNGGTLWYASITTLRQKKLFEWEELMAEVTVGLRCRAEP